MPRWLTRSAMFITLLLTLTACSRIGLAYRNLDLIIPWTLNDYLDIRGAQKDWFNERLKDHLTWHCTTQLPGYLDWLDRLKTMVQTDQVTDEALQQRTQEAEAAIAETAREITPSAIELLQGLNDDQVDDMDAAFVRTSANASSSTSSRRCRNRSRNAATAWSNAWTTGSARSPTPSANG